MANEEHLAVLKRGVEVWNAWRRENLGVQLDLSGTDLKYANLSGVDLRSAHLNHAKLIEADLSGAKLDDTAYERLLDLNRVKHCGREEIDIAPPTKPAGKGFEVGEYQEL